jgi:ubiquinone/menaquinone biosynthesis C-methylase UbiE
MTTSDRYIHGTGLEERGRLFRMNELLNSRALEAVAPQPGERVLDVGSGQGQMARALARATGVRALGIERDDDQRSQAIALAAAAGESDLVEFRPGDALWLPLTQDEAGTFDLVHCRFVLEHLRDPGAAVREMARAVAPGGRVHLQDDDHPMLTLHPDCPPWQAAWAAYIRAFEANGNDPLIGRKLTTLLLQAGLTPRRTGYIFYGACKGDAHFDLIARNIVEVMRTGRDLISEYDITDAKSYEAGLDAVLEWSHAPDAALWYAVNYAEGRS